jgi:hypothetical protein
MATPGVAGAAALVLQYIADGMFDASNSIDTSNPSSGKVEGNE